MTDLPPLTVPPAPVSSTPISAPELAVLGFIVGVVILGIVFVPERAVEIIGFAVVTIPGILAFLNSRKAVAKTEELKVVVDGRLTQLLEVSTALAHSEGRGERTVEAAKELREATDRAAHIAADVTERAAAIARLVTERAAVLAAETTASAVGALADVALSKPIPVAIVSLPTDAPADALAVTPPSGEPPSGEVVP